MGKKDNILSYDDYLKYLFDNNISLVEKIEGDNGKSIIYKDVIWESGEGKNKSFSINSDFFNINDLGEISSLMRKIINEDYEKYGLNNLYVLRGAGHKEVDIVNTIFEYQSGDITKKEMLLSLKEQIEEELTKED